jgi:hypothetical protein
MQAKRRRAKIESLEQRQLLSTMPTPAHVVVVVEENSSYNEIIGNSSAPYINSLAQGGASFTQSFAVSHPSQPNYLAIFSGSTQGITDDNGPISFSSANLRSTLAAVGQTFAGYSEDLPSTGSTVLTSGGYARKHNPWSDFTNVPSSENRPFSAFPTTYDSLPTVSFVVPNLNDDMHDGTVNQADQWLQSNLGGYATWAKTHNSLLVVTWDEDDGSQSNQVPTIFYGQSVVPGRYSESINHYNVLRTLEDMYGAQPVGASASATPITDVWQTTLAQSNTITGTSAADSITLKQDADHQHIDWTLGTTTAQFLISDPQGLTVNGNGGTDQITMDYTNGNPLPAKVSLAGTFKITGLQASNPLSGVTLNINSSTIYFNYAGTTDPASTLRGYLSNAYNGGHWNGAATSTTGVINSAAAQANPQLSSSIGWVDSADNTGFNTVSNSVELKYTMAGDANLDGVANSTDYSRLVANYKITPPAAGFAWDQGDFNFDRSVQFSDFAILAANYNVALSSITPAVVTANAAITPGLSAINTTTPTSTPTAAPTPVSTATGSFSATASSDPHNHWIDTSASNERTTRTRRSSVDHSRH